MARLSTGQSWALVLAGGDGTRLRDWTLALTGRPIPKQYCCIAGDESMLQATLARIESLVPPARTLVVVNRDHVSVAQRQLRGLPDANVLVQPCNRETGPGMTFSLLRLRERDPRATVAVFPSDHFIRDADAFVGQVERARALVERFPDKIVLLGMAADRADPGLGYIVPGAPACAEAEVFHVDAFVEKPDAALAERIVRRGGLWNSFVMLFRVDTMLHLLRQHRPADYELLSRLEERAYETLTPWNFSRDFLNGVPGALLVVRVGDIGWSDWGTPEAIERTLCNAHLHRLRRRLARSASIQAR